MAGTVIQCHHPGQLSVPKEISWQSFALCYLFTSRISHDISRREPEGLFSDSLSRFQGNTTSRSHSQVLLKSQKKGGLLQSALSK
jgi:hypothetical protein